MFVNIAGMAKPIPLVIKGTDGKDLFQLNDDGTYVADWHALRDCYEKFMQGERDQVVILAAAIWLGRNR